MELRVCPLLESYTTQLKVRTILTKVMGDMYVHNESQSNLMAMEPRQVTPHAVEHVTAIP